MTAQSDKLTSLEAENAELRRRLAHTEAALHLQHISGNAQGHTNGNSAEAYARRVLDNLFTFVGVLLPDGTLIEANRAPLEAAGIGPDDVIGKKFWECYWWSYAPAVQAQMQDAVTRANLGEVVRYDVAVRVAGDQRMWIDFQLAPLRDEAGRITHLIPSAMDITARRQAEERMQRSETVFRRIAEADLVGVGIGDLQGQVQYLNDEMLRMMGRTRAEFEAGAINWAACVAPESQPDLELRAEELMRDGRFSNFEHSFMKPDGTRTRLVGAAALIAPERGLHVTVCLDITPMRQSQAALLESEQRLQLALDAVQAGTFDINLLAAALPIVSAGTKQLFGFPLEARPSIDDFAQRVHPEDRALMLSSIQQAAEHGIGHYIEYRAVHADGRTVWLGSRAEAVRGSDGRIERLIGAVINITERKLREAHANFLSEIGEVLSRLSDPDEIMRVTGGKISNHLNASRVFFIEIDRLNELSIVLYDWCKDELPSTVGRYPISEYSDESFLNTLGAGECFIINDTASDPRLTLEAAAKFAALQVGAALNTPFLMHGQLRYVLAVQQRAAQTWQPDEIELMRDLTARLWPAIERARIEKALRQSEDRFRLATQAVQAVIYDWDMLQDQVSRSEELFNLLGFRNDEAGVADNRWFVSRVHPDDLSRSLGVLKQAIENGAERFEDEFRLQHKAGHYIWVRDCGVFLRDAQGRPMRCVGSITDITERRQSEDVLRESELRFRRLTETSIIGIISADMNKILTANDAFLNMVGYTREDLDAGRIEWPKMTPAEFAELDQTGLAQLVERGWCEPFEKEYFRKDGSHVPILIGAALLTHEPLTWICFVVDLTERRQTAERLQTANFRFRMAEEAANSLSYEWDLKTSVVERSVGLQKVLGYAPDEVPNTWEAWLDLMHRDDQEFDTQAQAIAYLNDLAGDSSSSEYRVRHKDGSYRWLSEHSLLFRDAQGCVRRIIGQSIDITDRKRAEEALRASETRYRELNATLETRVAERTLELAQSHEQLRELSAYVLRAREEDRTRIAREVHDELGGALTVLKMSLARAARGRTADVEFNMHTQDMSAQIDDMVKMVRRIASDLRPSILDDFGLVAAMEWQAQEWGQRTGITCRLDASLVPEDLQLGSECRTAMFRVFQESLTNVARHARATRVAATLQLDDDQLVLTVQDNGRGIDAALLINSKSLGLLGMRERVREVGGTFDIHSAPGQGTTVRVQVPLSISDL